MKHQLGCIADTKDKRDHHFTISQQVSLPASTDLRNLCPPVEDQGDLGSCTSFAGGAAIRVARKIQGLSDFTTSHLFLYYNSRSKSTKSVDAGATIRDMIKAAARYGDCPESDWPYIIDHFDVKPPTQSYTDALQDRVITYQRITQNIMQMKTCLALGFPFVIGISVYESFESQAVESTGIVPMPKPNEQLLGGHALLVVGYRDSDQHFIVRNSWGSGFGDGGYVYLPYQYLQDANLANDFWTVRAISK